MALVRRSFSKPSIADTGALSIPKTGYWGLYEFPQGGSPRVIDESEEINNRDFLWAVVSMPVFRSRGPFNTKPVVVRSFFADIGWIAYWIQVHDVEARGFCRPIVLTFANQNKEKTDLVEHAYRDKLASLAETMRKHAHSIFIEDLKKYVRGIWHCFERDPENAALSSKIKELEEILSDIGIDKKDCECAELVERDASYFLDIHDDLREIKELIGWSTLKPRVQETLKLPQDMLRVRACAFDAAFALGDAFDRVLELTQDSQRFDLQPLKPVIDDCLFSLLSGKVLVIKSQKITTARSIADALALLSPGDKPFDVAEQFEWNHSIVVCSKYEKEADKLTSVLRLDQSPTFSGESCPKNSFIKAEVEYAKTINGSNAWFLYLFQVIKSKHSELVQKLAEMYERALQTEEKMCQALHWNEADIPILEYWMACLFNKHRQRPILFHVSEGK